MQKLFEVISEDDDFLVINKPAGLVCHPTKGDVYSSLISRVRLYLGESQTSHLINRLDRETSGIVIVGKNAQVTAHLRRIWETREVEKEYVAIVHGFFPRDFLAINAPLGKDVKSEIAIKDTVVPGGVEAQTRVTLQKRFERDGKVFSLVRVLLLTGRKHQIRIHLAHAGHSIVGDKLYGIDEQLYLRFVNHQLTPEEKAALIFENHALHAARISFEWFGTRRNFQCNPEPWFRSFVQK